MAQIIPVVSDALQATIRRLLPSQTGFGEDLQAQNVIVPIIDLTPTAEGSILPDYLQTAMDFSTTTTELLTAGTSNISTTTGFYRLITDFTVRHGFTSPDECIIQLSDGLSVKEVYTIKGLSSGGTPDFENTVYELVVFVRAGDTLQLKTVGASSARVFSRQVADVNGNLTEPLGYVSQ